MDKPNTDPRPQQTARPSRSYSEDQTLEDNADICVELLAGRALCRECTIDPNGSVPEVDFIAYSSKDPEEFSKHLKKHFDLGHQLDSRFTEVATWGALLGR